MDQVYSVTQDNGGNFVCAANMMTYLESPEFDLNEDSDDDEEYEENGLNGLEDLQLYGVQVIRCAAHTLNLAVEDTFQDGILIKFLKKFRSLAHHLRTPTLSEKLRAANLTQAKTDNDTRWNSKYDMVLSLTRLRDFCEKEAINMSDEDWAQADIFLEVFKPTKIASKHFQSVQLCMGDFFKYWLDLTLKVQTLSLSSETKIFAEGLYTHLKVREQQLFKDNPTLSAALYLDPRFRKFFVKIRPEYFTINDAQDHLLKIYKQIKKIEVNQNFNFRSM